MSKERWTKVRNVVMVLVFIVGAGICNWSLSAGEKSSSLKFDGKDDFVKIMDSPHLNAGEAITIEAWIKPNETSGDSYTIIMKGTPWWSDGYGMDIRLNMLRFSLGNGIAKIYTDLVAPFTETSIFSHIVGIFDKGYMRIYINGMEKASKNTTLTDIGRTPDHLQLGTFHEEARWFNGSFDEIRIYNRALSPSEVDEHFKGVFKDETGLVLYIPFDEGAGDIATDYSGKGSHGVLRGYSETEKVAGYGDSHNTGWTTEGRERGVSLGFLPVEERLFYGEGEEIKVAWNITTFQPDKYKIKFEIRDKENKTVLTQEKEVEVKAGFNSIPFSFNSNDMPDGDCNIKSLLYKGEKVIESKEISILKLTNSYIVRKFLEVKAKRKELESLLEDAKNKGIDISYPKVSWAVSSLFEEFIGGQGLYEKEGHFKINHHFDCFLTSLNKAIEQIKEWIEDPSKQIIVPHISVNNLEIREGEFYQGKEPVLLLGSLGNFGRGYPLSEFTLYSSLGFNVTEACLGYAPLYTMPKEGELSENWFKEWDAYMKETERNNIAVYSNVGTGNFSPWVFKKYSSIFTCGRNYMPFCLTNPETKELWGDFLRKTIPLIKDYPNLLGYCVVNEPHYTFTGYCSHCQKAFREYLKREYRDINKLNKFWKTDYKDFNEAGIPPEGRTGPWWPTKEVPENFRILKPENPAPINEASMYDWQRFNQYRMTNFFAFMKDRIREKDKKSFLWWESPFVCATWGEFGEDDGIDREEIAKRSEINGCDGWISGFPGEKYVMGVDVSRYDLIKSLAPDKPLFNTEWHGVTHIGEECSYKEALKKRPPEFIRTSIWLAYLHGYSAGTLWAWGSGATGAEGGRWTMLDIPYFVETAGKTSLDLRRLAKEVIMFHKAPKEVVILFSMPSKLQHSAYLEEIKRFQSLGYVPEEAKSRASSTHSVTMEELNKVYASLYYLDTNYGFISEEQVKEGLLNKYKLLIIPRADYIFDETYEKIKDYVKNGGKILLISDSLNYDERGNKRDTSELFKSSKDLSLAGFPVKSSKLGKGEIYRIKPLSVAEYSKPFDNLLDETGIERTFRVTDTKDNSMDGIEFRVVKSEEGYLAYLINLNKKEVKVKLKGKGREINKAEELINNKSISFPLEIKPMDPLLIRIKK